MESGASAHETRDALGHTNLTLTNQYLSTSGIGLARAFIPFEQNRLGDSVKNSSSSTAATGAVSLGPEPATLTR